MELFGNLPAILGVALFIALVFLIKALLSPTGVMERRESGDRRKTLHNPVFPFYDSERNLVTNERRISQDRRKRGIYITTQELQIKQHKGSRTKYINQIR